MTIHLPSVPWSIDDYRPPHLRVRPEDIEPPPVKVTLDDLARVIRELTWGDLTQAADAFGVPPAVLHGWAAKTSPRRT